MFHFVETCVGGDEIFKTSPSSPRISQMYVVAYRIIVRKERTQGIHFIFLASLRKGRGRNNFETLTALAYLEARNFFYSFAGNVQNSSIKTMVNSFTVICPQCRKRLDKSTGIEDSPGAQAAASSYKPEATTDVCPSQLDEVRIRYDRHTDEVKA